MACSSCSSVTCAGCCDITVDIDSNGIQSVVDNGDGTFTITLEDGSATTITTNAVPADNWVELDEGTVGTALSWSGTATLNAHTFDLTYKVQDAQTVVILFHGDFNITTTRADDTVNFTFGIGNITSNWYVGNKKTTTYFNSIQSGDTAIISKPGGNPYTPTVGVVYSDNNNLIGLKEAFFTMGAGTWDIDIDFQITCKLA